MESIPVDCFQLKMKGSSCSRCWLYLSTERPVGQINMKMLDSMSVSILKFFCNSSHDFDS